MTDDKSNQQMGCPAIYSECGEVGASATFLHRKVSASIRKLTVTETIEKYLPH